MSTQDRHRRHDLSLEYLALLLGVGAGLLWAFPALLLGLIGAHLAGGTRAGRLVLWLVLLPLGLLITVLCTLHGLGQLVAGQLDTLAQQIDLHQGNLLQWEDTRLWATTWPVWLETLGLAPVIAGGHMLVFPRHLDGAALLSTQERQRQRAVARAHRRAARRVVRSHRLPDERDGQMVIGIPIEDEFNC